MLPQKKKKRVPVLPTTLFINHWLPPHLNSIQFGCERGKCPVEITFVLKFAINCDLQCKQDNWNLFLNLGSMKTLTQPSNCVILHCKQCICISQSVVHLKDCR